MTTRKSSHRKANRFETLSKVIEETKDIDIIKPSRITMDNDIKTYEKDSELRDSFKEFQNQTNARFYNIEHSFHQIT